MNLKIIFLDINGVLNSTGSAEAFGTRSELDPVSMGLLRRLVVKTDARIVITSSWRLDHSFSELRQIFRAAGGRRLEKRILDVTGAPSKPRSSQIYDWMSINKLNGAYVVLDDEALDIGPLVKCDPDYGFQYPEYRKALDILGEN